MDESVDIPKRLENEIHSLAANTPKPAAVTAAERERLRTRIKTLLKGKDAVPVVHYYVDEELQTLTDEAGASDEKFTACGRRDGTAIQRRHARPITGHGPR